MSLFLYAITPLSYLHRLLPLSFIISNLLRIPKHWLIKRTFAAIQSGGKFINPDFFT